MPSYSARKPIAAALKPAVQRPGNRGTGAALRIFGEDTSLSATRHLWRMIEHIGCPSCALLMSDWRPPA
jgi:hypothetical protein